MLFHVACCVGRTRGMQPRFPVTDSRSGTHCMIVLSGPSSHFMLKRIVILRLARSHEPPARLGTLDRQLTVIHYTLYDTLNRDIVLSIAGLLLRFRKIINV